MATKTTRTNKAIKSWFLTYPQSRETTMEQFRDCFKNVYAMKYCRVVKELHKDGNPHLHAVIIFEKAHTLSALKARAKKHFPGEDERIQYKTLRSKTREDFEIYFEKQIDGIEEGKFELRDDTKRLLKIQNEIRKWDELCGRSESKEEVEERIQHELTRDRIMRGRYEREREVFAKCCYDMAMRELLERYFEIRCNMFNAIKPKIRKF